jgi:hypothetical protein
MATEYLVEIMGWDNVLSLMLSPGGIPEEHTFQGGLVYLRHLEIEGRVHAPGRHRDKRFRVWLSAIWPPEPGGEFAGDLGSLEERASNAGKREILTNLYAPEAALPPAAVCLESSWKYLRVTTTGRSRGRAKVTRFSFSRSPDVRRKS